ncbi:hypothetical protein GUJ93_ZPchr0006g43888 [Zizania palustris]|uniref:Uncharacterized protein n=1 Tax=Zizania palustris TaxID=103762 RepID=A0A8J5VLU2_ZIZPA|nr:hypothetical protein GUJ93_ZPchr0006g43888 [Zizania palustris]
MAATVDALPRRRGATVRLIYRFRGAGCGRGGGLSCVRRSSDQRCRARRLPVGEQRRRPVGGGDGQWVEANFEILVAKPSRRQQRRRVARERGGGGERRGGGRGHRREGKHGGEGKGA